MNFFVSILLNGVAVYLIAQVLDAVSVSSLWTAIVFGIVLGILNAVVKPILKLLTLPISVLTLGLFLIVINGIMVLLADSFVAGFSVDGLFWAIIFSFLLCIVNGALSSLVK